MPMARRETLVQLSDELLAELDEQRGREGRSRSDLIRAAIEDYLAQHSPDAIDDAIVAAYKRKPQDDLGAEWSARAMIEAEPW